MKKREYPPLALQPSKIRKQRSLHEECSDKLDIKLLPAEAC